jgi:chemotaxis protein CheD
MTVSESHTALRPAERKVHIVQGEQHVDNDPHVILTTLLGSCIAACIWDAVAGVGGMNHFLLPGDETEVRKTEPGTGAMRYGVHAMELLVNDLLRHGAQRRNLQAKIFGGARMIKGLTDVGELNAAFVERFLKAENIPIRGGSVRGESGRRIQFWPVSGRARQVLLVNGREVFQAERLTPQPVTIGTVELF